LNFPHNNLTQCPHCSGKDENQLKLLRNRTDAESQGQKALGLKFLVCALILVLLIVVVNA